MMLEAKNDISMLHYEIMSGAQQIKHLSDAIALRLADVELKLAKEKEIRDDMQMLCNAYKEFDSLIIVDDFITSRTCDYQKGVFKAKATQSIKVPYRVHAVTGNGQEGNEYVLKKDDEFLKDTFPTHLTKAFMDSDLQTYYEYQRIVLSDSETLYGPSMYKDTLPARCEIVLEATEPVSECQIDGNIFMLNGLYFSHDNTAFTNALSAPIKLNHAQSIQSTGYQAFPSGKFIKLACESVDATSDKIGVTAMQGATGTSQKDLTKNLKAKNLEIEDTKPETGDSEYNTTTYIHKIESAKRKVIRLNEIQLMRSVYQNNTYFSTDNLLSYPVQAVALYADIYIPEHFKQDDYLLFELKINNKTFNVVPINSSLNGTKVIKTSNLELDAYYGEYIKEPITDVRLTVRFKCPNANESAVVKHIRLLVGDKYES